MNVIFPAASSASTAGEAKGVAWHCPARALRTDCRSYEQPSRPGLPMISTMPKRGPGTRQPSERADSQIPAYADGRSRSRLDRPSSDDPRTRAISTNPMARACPCSAASLSAYSAQQTARSHNAEQRTDGNRGCIKRGPVCSFDAQAAQRPGHGPCCSLTEVRHSEGQGQVLVAKLRPAVVSRHGPTADRFAHSTPLARRRNGDRAESTCPALPHTLRSPTRRVISTRRTPSSIEPM
jgi:hypothetical protein